MKRYPVYKDSYIEWIVASNICTAEYLDSVREQRYKSSNTGKINKWLPTQHFSQMNYAAPFDWFKKTRHHIIARFPKSPLLKINKSLDRECKKLRYPKNLRVKMFKLSLGKRCQSVHKGLKGLIKERWGYLSNWLICGIGRMFSLILAISTSSHKFCLHYWQFKISKYDIIMNPFLRL